MTDNSFVSRHRHILIVMPVLAGIVYAVLACTQTGDYMLRGAVSGDNPAPALHALLGARLAGFVWVQPMMGVVSLLWRLPGVAVAGIFGDAQLLDYRLGVACCLLTVPLLCLWLSREWSDARISRLSLVLLGLLLVTGPVTLSGLRGGHPEELLASVLAVGAVLAGRQGLPNLSGIALGLAIGTKQWAVIAIVPVAMVNTRARGRALLFAAAVAVAAELPALADPRAFLSAARQVGDTHFVGATSLWWSVSPHAHAAAPVRLLPWGLDRSSASLLVCGVAAAGAWLTAARRGAERNVDPLAVLVVLALVRCLGDAQPLQYYYEPVVVSLGAWEILSRSRPPFLAAAVSAAVAWAFGPGLALNPDLLSVLVIAAASGVGALVLRSSLAFPAVLDTLDTVPSQ